MSSPDLATRSPIAFSPLPGLGSRVVYPAFGAGLLLTLTIVLVLAGTQQPSADADRAPPPAFEQFTIMP